LLGEENFHDHPNRYDATEARMHNGIPRRTQTHFLPVAIKGEARFDQAQVISAQVGARKPAPQTPAA
jgi:hypothetical protein